MESSAPLAQWCVIGYFLLRPEAYKVTMGGGATLLGPQFSRRH